MALSTIRRFFRFGSAPSDYQKSHFDNWAAELNDYAFRETQPISLGWSTGTYNPNNRGPIGNASITSASNFAAGSQTIVVSAATGSQNNVPWAIATNMVLEIEPGTANAEYVLATGVSGTSITATFANAHNGSITPYVIYVPVIGPNVLDLLNTLINDMKQRGYLGS